MKKRNRRRSTTSRTCRTRRTQFESLEQRCVLSATPTLAPIADLTLYEGAPINLPLDAIYDLEGPLTYTVTCSDPNVEVYVPEGNRSMKITVSAENGTITGDMIFELFEQRAPRATSQIISLAEDGFYDGLIFHRVDDLDTTPEVEMIIIQGGDPTGTGSGGSYLGDFDDQFHFELMHTSSGVLSMAKSSDDTNDCQFFITGSATRFLDFNHTVFGQLVEGEDVREALSRVSTDTNDRPINDVIMESVEIFEDTENGILVISAPDGYTGSSTVTITVTIKDQYGNEYVQTPINVTIAEDTEDSDPFLADLPTMRTTVDTPYSIDISQYVQDADGGVVRYFDADAINYFVEQNSPNYSEYIPYYQDDDLGYVSFLSEDSDSFTSGVINFEPTNGIVGTYPFTIGVASALGYLDKQVAALNIVPEDAPSASIEMRLVTEPTTVDDQGEVDALPADKEWVHAWEECSVEVWAKIDDAGQFGIYSVSTDLNFDPEQYQVSNIEWGIPFNQEQTGTIDNVNGTVTGLGGTTKWYTVTPYTGPGDNYPSDVTDLVMWGDDRYVLVARVDLTPVVSDQMTVQSGVGYNSGTAASFSLTQGDVKWNAVDGTDVTADGSVATDIWAVPYDLDGSGKIDLRDITYFVVVYGLDINDPSNDWGHACDFNRDGYVNLQDLNELVPRYGYQAGSGIEIQLEEDYPPAAALASQSASLMGTLSASDLASLQQDNDSQEDDEDEINAVDQIMAYYADFE